MNNTHLIKQYEGAVERAGNLIIKWKGLVNSDEMIIDAITEAFPTLNPYNVLASAKKSII